MILAAVLAVLVAQAPDVTAPDPPVLREIVLEGVSSFSRDEVLKGIRLREGGRFFRDPQEVAASVRVFYELRSFVAVRASARFEPEAGRLTLTVDEGRLQAVDLEGVDGDEEARVRALLALAPGPPLQEKAINEAVDRLEAATGGAYTVERGMYWTIDDRPGGPVLRLPVVHRRFKLRPLLSGPDAAPFSNRVEGKAPAGGVDVTVFHGITENHLSVYGQAAYGFESDQWRHAVGARRSFGPGRLLTVGYEHHDATDTDDLFRRRPIEGQRARPIYFLAVDDYFRRTGDEAYVFVRPTPRINLGVSFRDDRHESMPVVADDGIFFFSREPRPNPQIDEGQMRTLLFTARWTKDAPLYERWIDEQDSFLLRTVYGTPFRYAQGARFEGTYELATDALGGDFSFGRFTGQVHAARAVGARHHLLGRVLGGFTNGDPPLQRRFALGGLGTVRGYSYKQFPGEEMVVATGEWMMTTRGRWPSVVAFADGGRAWTSGVDGAGWKSSAGVGLDFRPLRRGYARVDVAFPFQKSPGQDWARVYGLIQLPF